MAASQVHVNLARKVLASHFEWFDNVCWVWVVCKGFTGFVLLDLMTLPSVGGGGVRGVKGCNKGHLPIKGSRFP